MNKKAVILLSGGLDSTTVLGIAKSEGFTLYALSFCYGQRHDIELKQAEKIALRFDVAEHAIINIDLRRIGGSALTSDVSVPKNRSLGEMEENIPITYVPARNTVFLSLALGWAEVLGAADIFIGVNALDYSGYPDCRPEYIAAFENLANLATSAGVENRLKFSIHTPLINLTKAQIIEKGLALGIDYSLTHSCYDPNREGLACGKCDSCQLRLKGFQEIGSIDPIKYE
ncbi:MAG: 7-cyano-7-deazaguanine synthase QueC [Acidobacteria bacterium]|nr:7-cyano-7-deazaguanine synthase QueC [Acidobacteriota bacterium]